MGKKRTPFTDAAAMNIASFGLYYDQLMQMSISMFEWVGLPDTVDERFLELILFTNGSVVFFQDEVLGYLALSVSANGPLNVYNIPINRRAYATNHYQKELTEKDSVIIYNNMLHTPCHPSIRLYATRLADLDRTIDVNTHAQKTPVLILCDESQQLTMKNLYQKYDGNEPFIFGNKALNASIIQALKTDAPYVADKLYMLKSQIWNDALTYLGISNTNTTKKERLVQDEVARTMGGVVASRFSRLNARKQACEQINKMFGLNIDVRFREVVEDLTRGPVETEESQVAENG